LNRTLPRRFWIKWSNLSATVLGLADLARSFQHGRVQSYLLYLCTAILTLAVAVILSTG
jgi:hypothetical protein